MPRDVFVNPYTFASLPSLVPRREPPGHDGGRFTAVGSSTPETRYSGSFIVRWTLVTSLVLPPEVRTPHSDDGQHPLSRTRIVPDVGGTAGSDAVREIKVGPSESPCGGGLQTASCCVG